ncbi:glycerophosphodiester phosphodiesterase family protein [Ornithinimicrobium panacihumi]|uniref:glycerophosphodiester phosphodiesterase family protein n=1 Tax=Ornithinimicrobium panacihumi TaxID=2008449 RepID=UPI003F8B7F6F
MTSQPIAVTALTRSRPLVVAHRGASGYRPEQTREAYTLAARQGADLLELDVISTADHVLVARHENNLAGTTDIATRPEFAARRTTKVVDGERQDGWFTEDLTLAELRTLRAVERLPDLRPDSAVLDGQLPILTVEEVFELRAELAVELGRPVGLYPEIKHSAYFAALGLPIEPVLADLLARFDQNRSDGDVLLHAFEPSSLATLADLGVLAPRSQLMWNGGRPADAGLHDPDYAWWSSQEGLAELVRRGVSGISPDLSMVVSVNEDHSMGSDTGLAARAHEQGLWVHPYTFRAENAFLFTDFRRGDGGSEGDATAGDDPAVKGDLAGMVSAFLDVGIDAVNTDHPDLAVATLTPLTP